MNKRVFICQTNYIPWKGFFDSLNMADYYVMFDDVQYTKRDWRNRNRIKTQNGSEWLTIPVEVKGRFFQKIRDTKISDPHWATRHWKKIKQSYSKAPYFKTYSDQFEELYLTTSSNYLSEVNERFLRELCKILNINVTFVASSNFPEVADKTGRLIAICQALKCSTYLSGPSAQTYLVEDEFPKAQLKLEYLNYEGYPEYPQLFGSFVHELSIVDLIFNTGPNAQAFMKSFPKVV